MPRFSHDDPQYRAALKEMARNIRRLMEDRNWNQADLARHSLPHIPPGGRFGADNASNFAQGKRKPTKPFIKAMCAAFGVEEAEIMPPLLLDTVGGTPRVPSLLTEVHGKEGIYRVFIDREMSMDAALIIAEAFERAKKLDNAKRRPDAALVSVRPNR